MSLCVKEVYNEADCPKRGVTCGFDKGTCEIAFCTFWAVAGFVLQAANLARQVKHSGLRRGYIDKKDKEAKDKLCACLSS